ncbi:inorganic diphosphatase [Mucilaginibacter terrenus]|uniref:inorganic diphosphatase n=1 Tax=Mucilaginibacter terrenus TaxID=2482727 RepID=A0A3E2NT22_9SPHI|nr:inorganic diphosphatase [Mucilaginibacter terrenus]RFZ84071.1 inorganic diphosphatase [Mucilaginibacter terrenus]
MEPVTVIVESPRGANHKFNYEPKENRFKLAKILPAGMVFPFDFGFIPGTKGGDGDPLDVVVISEITGFPGCAMDCRIIGALKAEQTERDGKTTRNDRFLAVPVVSQLFAEVTSILHLSEAVMNQIEHFFKNYNDQAGKKFEVLSRINEEDAFKLIK